MRWWLVRWWQGKKVTLEGIDRKRIQMLQDHLYVTRGKELTSEQVINAALVRLCHTHNLFTEDEIEVEEGQ